MINYDPFWNTLKQKGLTKYSLYTKYDISKQTLWRMSKNKPILSTTINELCKALNCKIEDILVYIPDEEFYELDHKVFFNEESSDYGENEENR